MPCKQIVPSFLFPVLYSRPSPAIYFAHSSVHTSILISQSIPPPSPLGVHTFVLYICVSISALQIGSSVPFLFFFKSGTCTFGEKPKWGDDSASQRSELFSWPPRINQHWHIRAKRRPQQQIRGIDLLGGKMKNWRQHLNTFWNTMGRLAIWNRPIRKNMNHRLLKRLTEDTSKWELIIELFPSISASIFRPEAFDF